MKIASVSPFVAVIVLGIVVFSSHQSLDRTIDLTQWKANQKILLLIENCQDGQLSADACNVQIPRVLDHCRTFHVLACDDQRLAGLLDRWHANVETG